MPRHYNKETRTKKMGAFVLVKSLRKWAKNNGNAKLEIIQLKMSNKQCKTLYLVRIHGNKEMITKKKCMCLVLLKVYKIKENLRKM